MKIQGDSQLLEQLKGGSLAAFEQLFKQYYKLLNIYAFYILQDEMEAEDLVQSFFIDFWEKQLFQNINSSIKAYLKTAIHNRCLKILDKKKVSQKRISGYLYTLTETEIEENVEENPERETLINKILVDMPNQRLQAFTLVHLKNKKYKEASQEMGISVNSLKTHLKLAVKVLKHRLTEFK